MSISGESQVSFNRMTTIAHYSLLSYARKTEQIFSVFFFPFEILDFIAN